MGNFPFVVNTISVKSSLQVIMQSFLSHCIKCFSDDPISLFRVTHKEEKCVVRRKFRGIPKSPVILVKVISYYFKQLLFSNRLYAFLNFFVLEPFSFLADQLKHL